MPDEYIAREEYITRKEFEKAKDKIYEKTSKNERDIERIDTLCKSLSSLPEAITNLDKTMIKMEINLTNLNNEFKEFIKNTNENDSRQDQKIKSIDEKSKVDFLEWVKNNWVGVFIVIATLITWLMKYVN